MFVFPLLLAGPLDPLTAWDAWPSARYLRTPAPCLRHAELMEQIGFLEARHAGWLRSEQVGQSVEGRPIRLLQLGSGARRVLFWSQMHGDEPSATPALLDLADYLLSRAEEPDARSVLEGTTLLMIPMLNPDGAERYSRRNAHGIDVNRDALNIATPEGRILKSVRDRFEPVMGFNLHDQDRRTTVGETGVLATISLLAVAGDPQGTSTPGKARTKRACSAVVWALGPLIPGGIARYDEDWSPRAFGDNLTSWGSPVVLIESGGPPPGSDLETLTRLNFVALLGVLRDLVRDDLGGHDPALYESLPRNQTRGWADVVIRGGRLWQPGFGAPFRADLAFDLLRDDRLSCGGTPAGAPASEVVEVGDARFLGAGREVDAAGGTLVPAFVASVRGLEAAEWLTSTQLQILGRLGVATLLWHLSETERTHAETLAAHRSSPGGSRIEMVDLGVPLAWLELDGAVVEPASRTLAALLDALGAPGWRDVQARSGLDDLLSRLAGPTRSAVVRPRPVPVLPGTPASVVLLRPTGEEGLDLATATAEKLWIDGVEARGQAR